MMRLINDDVLHRLPTKDGNDVAVVEFEQIVENALANHQRRDCPELEPIYKQSTSKRAQVTYNNNHAEFGEYCATYFTVSHQEVWTKHGQPWTMYGQVWMVTTTFLTTIGQQLIQSVDGFFAPSVLGHLSVLMKIMGY